MTRNRSSHGPQFVEFFGPVLDGLRELGGSGRPTEVVDWIADNHTIPDELNEELASGTTRFNKNVHWARFYLAKAGYIDSSQRGVWSLSEKGINTHLNHNDALDVFYEVQELLEQAKDKQQEALEEVVPEDDEDEAVLDYQAHRTQLLNKLRNLSPGAFERFCQRLLREAGFDNVKVTGRSGDGGIDGQGILKINQFVSFQVAFQSKRYNDRHSIGPDVVRDFRGAIMGRADKGIILTTGAFSSQARSEATRDGATPIELVDGNKLVELLEELELGLRDKQTITIFEVDEDFFDQFEERL